MKNIIRALLNNSIIKTLIKWLAIFFYYKSEIFSSKWFTNHYIGYVWLLNGIWFQRVLGFNRLSRYIVHHTTRLSSDENLIIHPDSIDALTSPGCYFQNFAAKIRIGKSVLIGPNVGIITANHDPTNPSEHLPGQDVELGDGCWIGMNCVILPGVVLGPKTIVSAGSVVNKSFPEGNVLIAGIPAEVKKAYTRD